MDNINKRILSELQRNARISYADLGKKIGLSSPAIAERINKLEEIGIIKRYTAQIDYEKIGFSIRAIIRIQVIPAKMQSLLKYLRNHEFVYECNRITGEDCLIMKIVLKQAKDLEVFIDSLSEYGNSTTSIILSTPIEDKSVIH